MKHVRRGRVGRWVPVGLALLMAVAILWAWSGVGGLAVGPFERWFFGLLVVAGLVLRWPDDGFGLAMVPAVGLVLVATLPGTFPLEGWSVWYGGLGVVALLAGGWWAVLARDLARLARAVALGFGGLGLLAVGLGADRAASMAVLANGVIAPVLGLAAVTLEDATGSSSLDALGGLARGMPKFSLLLLAGCCFAGLVPLGPGFVAYAAVWHAAVARGAVVGMVALAVWAPAMGFGALRAFGMVCLGRPHSLRAAAAEDAAQPVLIAMAVLAAAGLVMGAFSWAWVGLAGIMGILAVLVVRVSYRGPPVESAGHDDGFARPPAWLPFGDPATQIDGSGFSARLRPPRLRPRLRRVRRGLRLVGRALRA